ncbi:acyl carrier protein [Micromonospora sp. NPDC002296]|uniref:acyl carrier protein n=1 Tax=Micromonospora sp. NPDC002296 TaxID=3154271 RepID=UPI0033295654
MTVHASADSIRTELRAHLAGILYCELAEIDDDATLTELGLDSVLGVELVTLVNSRYGLQESLDTLYEHPTVNQLTRHVHDQVAQGQAAGR